MRNDVHHLALAGVLGALSIVLAGCVAAPPPPQPSPVERADSTPAPVVASPLTCDELVPTELVTSALTGADGIPPTVTPAVWPSSYLSDYVTEPAGGLVCSWRAGEPPISVFQHTTGEDWAYLRVEVLPGGAEGWDAWAHDDGGHEDLTTFAGVEAVAGCGDPGCNINTAAGDASVRVTMTAAGWIPGTSRFEGTGAELLRQLEPATAAAISTITDARPEQLAWPRIAAPTGSAECDGALDPAGIAAALNLEQIELRPARADLAGTAAEMVGLYSCQMVEPLAPYTAITVGRGLAPVLETVASMQDTSATFDPVTLVGAADGERALLSCDETGVYCSLLFSIGDTAYQVGTQGDATAIAEAMIAQAR